MIKIIYVKPDFDDDFNIDEFRKRSQEHGPAVLKECKKNKNSFTVYDNLEKLIDDFNEGLISDEGYLAAADDNVPYRTVKLQAIREAVLRLGYRNADGNTELDMIPCVGKDGWDTDLLEWLNAFDGCEVSIDFRDKHGYVSEEKLQSIVVRSDVRPAGAPSSVQFRLRNGCTIEHYEPDSDELEYIQALVTDMQPDEAHSIRLWNCLNDCKDDVQKAEQMFRKDYPNAPIDKYLRNTAEEIRDALCSTL